MIKNKEESSNFFKLAILLVTSAFGAFVIMLLTRGLLEGVSKEFIGFLFTASLTLAGFGLLIFQINGIEGINKLKDDFLDVSIFMMLSALAGMGFLAYPNNLFYIFNLGHISIFFFLWGFTLFLLILITIRFRLVSNN